MYELNGKKYTIEQLEEYAAKSNMEYNTYLETMKGKGLQEMTSDMTDEDALVKKAEDIKIKNISDIYDRDLTQEEAESYYTNANVYQRGDGLDFSLFTGKKGMKRVINKEGDNVDAIYNTQRKDENGLFIYRRTKDSMNSEEVEQLASNSYKKLLDSDEYISGFSEKAMESNKVNIQNIISQARLDYDVHDVQGLADANKYVSSQINNLIQESAAADEEYQKRTNKYSEIIGNQYASEINGKKTIEKRQDFIDELAKDSWVQSITGGVLNNDWHAGVANFNAQVGSSWNGFWNGNYGQTIQENRATLDIINDPDQELTPVNYSW